MHSLPHKCAEAEAEAKKKAKEEQAERKPFGEAVLLALQQSMLGKSEGKSEIGEKEFPIIYLNTNKENIKTFKVQLRLIILNNFGKEVSQKYRLNSYNETYSAVFS